MKKELNGKKMIIDFDSTFVKVEALDELSKIALENKNEKEKIVREIEKITNLGMEGKITFPESLERRLRLFKTNQQNIDELIQLLKGNISDSFLECRDFIKENSDSIWIISGGFEDYICPVVFEFGIAEDHVLANKFLFDGKGQVLGFDKSKFLAQEDGKVMAIDSLGLNPKEVTVVGDGFTDYKIKEAGCAYKFFAFCENVRRESVVEKADFEASNFSEVIQIFHA